MPKFMITYLGGDQPATPEEGKANFAKYQEWLASLGDAAVAPMNPLKNTHTVHADRSVTKGSSVAMTGYTVVDVDTMEEAIEMASRCPFLDTNGSLEVAEMIQMGGS